MENLRSFTIPFTGLNNGKHVFTYEIDESFFEHFEGSPVEDGDVYVHLTFDKRESFFILDFFIDGSVMAECDRCLDKFELPVNGNFNMYVKFREEDFTPKEEADVMYISWEETEINVAQLIYEYIILCIPIQKTCDMDAMQDKQCNVEIMKILQSSGEKNKKEEKTDPRWDRLKKLSDN